MKKINLSKIDEIVMLESVAGGVDNVLYVEPLFYVMVVQKMTDIDLEEYFTKDGVLFVEAYSQIEESGILKQAIDIVGYQKVKSMLELTIKRYEELNFTYSKLIPTDEEIKRLTEVLKVGDKIGNAKNK